MNKNNYDTDYLVDYCIDYTKPNKYLSFCANIDKNHFNKIMDEMPSYLSEAIEDEDDFIFIHYKKSIMRGEDCLASTLTGLFIQGNPESFGDLYISKNFSSS